MLLFCMLTLAEAGWGQQSVFFTGRSATVTNTGPVDFYVRYAFAAPNLTAGQVTLVRTGTANGTVSVLNGNTVNVTIRVSNCTGDGTLQVQVPQSQQISDAVTIDNTPPVLTIDPPSTNVVPAGGSAYYRLNYTDAYDVSISAEDITLLTTGTATASISIPDGTSIQPIVQLSNVSGSGTLAIAVEPGLSNDFVGNRDTGTGTSQTITVDGARPSVSISAPMVADGFESITYVLQYSGADSINLRADRVVLGREGTANGDLLISGGTFDNPFVIIQNVRGTGRLWITVIGGAAQDSAGNRDTGAGPSEAVILRTGGTDEPTWHTADQDRDERIELSGLLRVVQFYNIGIFHCDADTEDGYAPGSAVTKDIMFSPCYPHSSDFRVEDFSIDLRELLRVIQLFNAGGYRYCPFAVPHTEDDYCIVSSR
jgi:hypothetical protein